MQTYQTIKSDTVFIDRTMPEKGHLEAFNGVRGFDPETIVNRVSTVEQVAMIIQAAHLGSKII